MTITPKDILDTAAWCQSEDELRDTLRQAATALEIALSASPAGVVKPLEWENYTDGSGYIAFDAITMIGQYSVWRIDDDRPWLLHVPGSSDHIEHANAEAAKSAAFEDYSARIMSAIEPAGVGVETVIRSAGLKARDELLERMADGGTVDNDLADYMTRIVDACVRASLKGDEQ